MRADSRTVLIRDGSARATRWSDQGWCSTAQRRGRPACGAGGCDPAGAPCGGGLRHATPLEEATSRLLSARRRRSLRPSRF